MLIDGTDLGNISAGTLRIGNLSDATLGISGAATTASIDAGPFIILADIDTLELRSQGDITFGGTVEGGFNLTTIFAGNVNFNAAVGASGQLGTVRFETPLIPAPGGGDVTLNGVAIPAQFAFGFEANRVEIAIAGAATNNQLLVGTSTTFDGMNVDTLSVERAASVNLFGSIGGDNTQTAASRIGAETPNGRDGDWLFNGCVINTLQCFNVPVILPVVAFDLSLDEERLLREPLEEEEEEFNDLLSNTGNEELW